MLKLQHIFLFSILIISLNCCAQKKSSAKETIDYEIVIPDLKIPWGFVFLPDHSILLTEKSGELILFKNGKKIHIQGVPEVYRQGQGGLLDIILHPNYNTNGWIYLSYASTLGSEKGGHTAIMRARLKNNKLVDQELIYKAAPNTTAGEHFGSRLLFDREHYLYFSIGERGQAELNAQDITRDGGKIYRVHDDGRIPDDNPFVQVPNAKTAIFTYGNRNPQGLALHPETGAILSHEHGPKGGDEINIIESGKNYGWPLVTYGVNYNNAIISQDTSRQGMQSPIYQWTPSIAPSGMAFVTSDIYPLWKGDVLVGSLKFQYLNRLSLEQDKVINEEQLLKNLGRVRTVHQGPDGYIYVAIEQLGIVKLLPKM